MADRHELLVMNQLRRLRRDEILNGPAVILLRDSLCPSNPGVPVRPQRNLFDVCPCNLPREPLLAQFRHFGKIDGLDGKAVLLRDDLKDGNPLIRIRHEERDPLAEST